MLEDLIFRYYAEDELDAPLLSRIDECCRRAEAHMNCREKQILRDAHSFHDWYLTECWVYCEQDEKKCRLGFANGHMRHQILLSCVDSLAIHGEFVSDKAKYPHSEENASIAQVLSLWLDYQDGFVLCLLLDNERYLRIRAKRLCIQE